MTASGDTAMKDNTNMSGNNGGITDDESRTFLAMVPRGLQGVVTNEIHQIVPTANVTIVGEASETPGQQARDALSPSNPWFAQPVGTVSLSPMQHVSVGYQPTNKDSTLDNTLVWSVPGTIDGSVWLQIETQATHVAAISSIRGIGPVLALVTTYRFTSLQNPTHALSDFADEFSQWFHPQTYHRQFDAGFQLWKEYVRLVWKDYLTADDYSNLQQRVTTNQLRFRTSCLRNHHAASGTTTPSKKTRKRENTGQATYSRQELLQTFMERWGSQLVPYYAGRPTTTNNVQSGWSVQLKQFDIEIVWILLSNGWMATVMSLLPYPYVKAKSFASGGVPPDLTHPYLGGDALAGLLRLRPSTSRLLLSIAQLQPSDVVLDPCAGMGTIPLEADAFSRTFGLGGDLGLETHTMRQVASTLEHVARFPKNQTRKSHASLLAAWDAAYLPIRTASIDVVASDLPFGQQCLSASSLNRLLPLIFWECARILTPSDDSASINGSRMVLLCGNPTIVAEALHESRQFWKLPCTLAFPATIGGILAWVIRIERNGTAYDDSMVQQQQRDKLRKRVQGLAHKRDRVRRQQEGTNPNSRKRRIQS